MLHAEPSFVSYGFQSRSSFEKNLSENQLLRNKNLHVETSHIFNIQIRNLIG